MKTEIPKKKILHIITGLGQGGAEGVLTRLCLHTNMDFQHIVLSLSDEGVHGKTLRDAGIRVHCLNIGINSFAITKALLVCLKLITTIRIIKSENPDIVQTWMYHADLIGGVAAKLLGCRKIFWNIRMSAPKRGELTWISRAIVKLCVLISHRVPNKIIFASNESKIAHKNIGYPEKKAITINNGIDLSLFYPDIKKRNQLRKQLGLSEQEFALGMVARFDPLKDHENLLDALAIAKESISFTCLLIGKGLLSNKIIMRKIKKLGLEENINIIGPRDNIEVIMNALDLHVLSSSSEGFPNVLVEAMACGTPSVSTSVGDALAILGDSTMCCAPKDPSALSNLIIQKKHEWENKEKWENKRASAVNRAEQFFSIKKMACAYASAWESLESK